MQRTIKWVGPDGKEREIVVHMGRTGHKVIDRGDHIETYTGYYGRTIHRIPKLHITNDVEE